MLWKLKKAIRLSYANSSQYQTEWLRTLCNTGVTPFLVPRGSMTREANTVYQNNFNCKEIAHSYPERVENQDKICLSFKELIEKRCAPCTAFVWLQLSELGHSA